MLIVLIILLGLRFILWPLAGLPNFWYPHPTILLAAQRNGR